MTRSLNDCHTFFLPPRRSESFSEMRSGRGSVGVGVELAPVRPAYVREVISGGPADSAGVRLGDQLLVVDDRDDAVRVARDVFRRPEAAVAAARLGQLDGEA